MKKKNFNQKLNLKKETVVSLNGSQMREIQGMGTQMALCTGECPMPTRLIDNTCEQLACYSQGCGSDSTQIPTKTTQNCTFATECGGCYSDNTMC